MRKDTPSAPTGQSLSYSLSTELPVTHSVDVVVIGGGPGGIGAATMAARAGARTLLVERYGGLGGMASYGEVHPFMPNQIDDIPLDQPVYTDWCRKITAYHSFEWQDRQINKDAASLAAEDVVLEAGAEILYHHTLFDALVSDGAIDAAVLSSKSGLSAVKAQVFIDCSGDGDLAARAGCGFEIGGPSGFCQPMTTCFKLGNVKTAQPPSLPQKELRAMLTKLWQEAQHSGELDCPRDNCLVFGWIEEGVLHFNTTRVIQKSGIDGMELSAAEQEARRQIRQIIDLFRRRAPGFEKCHLHSVAHHIGIRETRRILGHAWLTRDDFKKKAKFDDAICRCRYPIDIHNPDGSGTELISLPSDDWYEIPYGCIVARDCTNLLVGGRPISVDHAVHGSARIMPHACSLGQAAGMAAAMAVMQKCAPSALDGILVRQRLVEAGAVLAEFPPGKNN